MKKTAPTPAGSPEAAPGVPAKRTAKKTARKTATGSTAGAAVAKAKPGTASKVSKAGAGSSAGQRDSSTPEATPEAQLTEYRRKRDFTKTAEPAGGAARRTGELRFVIQKHAASRLHYDLRLEIDGVMKSWAVPKGPSADPKVRRLAMQVEDHPVEYNSFEGTIPAGEYGGGTVMLWDTGTYSIEDAAARPQNDAAHDEYDRGELKLYFHGKRIQGSYALVRTKGQMRGSNSSKPSWLLLKHRDDEARSEQDPELTTEFTDSVVSGRDMDEIRERRTE